MKAFFEGRRLTTLLLALGIVCTARAQEPSMTTPSMTADEQAVWASVEATWQHFAAGDLDAALADYEHWHRWGIDDPGLWNRADLREHDVRGRSKGHIEDGRLEPVRVQVFGDAAVVHYIAHVTFVFEETGERFPETSRWSDFRIREGGRWVIVGGYRDGLCELVGEGERSPEGGKACREFQRDVSDGSWAHRTLTAGERARYAGTYAETLDPGMKPISSRVWEEDGILYITPLKWNRWDEIHLVPMGKHEFVQGRFEDGRLVEVYQPDTRVRFTEEGGRVVGYAFVSDGAVRSEAKRIQ